jgi:hypothetical protein
MLFLAAIIFVSYYQAAIAANPAYVCSACLAVGGLMEEIGFQIKLSDGLKSKCGSSQACILAVDAFIYKLTSGARPEDICNASGLCTQGCTLFSQWPVKLPPARPEWPIERRSLLEEADLSLIAPLFEAAVGSPHDLDNSISVAAHIAFTLSSLTSKVNENACGHNVTCKALVFADQHVPLQVFEIMMLSIYQIFVYSKRILLWLRAACI